MIIAISIISIGLIGVMSLIHQTIISSSFASSRLTAAYLAQEGIEIIRNVRDTNWLEARTSDNSWDEGLNVCSASGFIADYNHPGQLDPEFPCYSGQVLNIDSNGFYSYSSGSPTKFKRKIVVTKSDSDMINVSVEVIWTEKGRNYTYSVQENLYNWR
jgi:hypothetical protein